MKKHFQNTLAFLLHTYILLVSDAKKYSKGKGCMQEHLNIHLLSESQIKRSLKYMLRSECNLDYNMRPWPLRDIQILAW